MDEHKVLTKLVYLLVHADGQVDPKELAMCEHLVLYEKMSEAHFVAHLEDLKGTCKKQLTQVCIEDLKDLGKETQERFMAWAFLLANSDGIMDNAEWDLIFTIYHKGLQLSNRPIMDQQQELWTAISKRKRLAA